MIWTGGEVVPEEALTVGVLDRTFEHGIGLFETFRTWKGDPRLLPRHLARMAGSAAELGLRNEPNSWPDSAAVVALLSAERREGDAMLRITLTGGSANSPSRLWVRAATLPPPTRPGGAAVSVGAWEVARSDALARHKTLNYWAKRRAFEAAAASGFDEALSTTADTRCVWEGSRTNLFLVARGELVTPTLDGPVLPGVMRGLVIELARGLGLVVRDAGEVSRGELENADEVFLTNAVRGIVPVSRIGDDGPVRRVAGPLTDRLTGVLDAWLYRKGDPT